YARFIAPGLIVLWVVTCSYGHTAGGLLGARIFKYIEELLVSPLPRWIIMLGYVIGGMIRGLIVGIAVVLTALFFTQPEVQSVSASIAALMLTALVSALGGLVTAMFARSFEQVTAIQVLVLTPLTFVGGVFNSISTLPDWAQVLSRMNPLFYMVNAIRYG